MLILSEEKKDTPFRSEEKTIEELLQERKRKQEEAERIRNEQPGVLGDVLLGAAMGWGGALSGTNNGAALAQQVFSSRDEARQKRIDALDKGADGVLDTLQKLHERKEKLESDKKQREEANELKRMMIDSQNTRALENRALKERELALKESELSQKAGSTGSGKSLQDISTRKMVEGLSELVVKKEKARAMIKSAVDQLEDPNKSEDQKVVIGQGLLKLLNDPEFSDAVGVEETKRLGAYLELFSLTRPGSTVGRDVPRFTQQVKDKLELVDLSKTDLQTKLENLINGSASYKSSPSKPPLTRERALELAKKRERLKGLL